MKQKQNSKKLWILSSILLIIGSLLIVFVLPLMQPPVTIQCVSAPCIVPNITIFEYFTQYN